MKEFWQENNYELITTFFIFTNLFPAWFPQWMYYIAFVLIALKFGKFEKETHPKAGLFCLGIYSYLGKVIVVCFTFA